MPVLSDNSCRASLRLLFINSIDKTENQVEEVYMLRKIVDISVYRKVIFRNKWKTQKKVKFLLVITLKQAIISTK